MSVMAIQVTARAQGAAPDGLGATGGDSSGMGHFYAKSQRLSTRKQAPGAAQLLARIDLEAITDRGRDG
jgi:hypothetical protein